MPLSEAPQRSCDCRNESEKAHRQVCLCNALLVDLGVDGKPPLLMGWQSATRWRSMVAPYPKSSPSTPRLLTMNPFPQAPGNDATSPQFLSRQRPDEFSPPRNRQETPPWLGNDRNLRASLFRLKCRAETRHLTQRFDPRLDDISKPAVKQKGALMNRVSF